MWIAAINNCASDNPDVKPDYLYVLQAYTCLQPWQNFLLSLYFTTESFAFIYLYNWEAVAQNVFQRSHIL